MTQSNKVVPVLNKGTENTGFSPTKANIYEWLNAARVSAQCPANHWVSWMPPLYIDETGELIHSVEPAREGDIGHRRTRRVFNQALSQESIRQFCLDSHR